LDRLHHLVFFVFFSFVLKAQEKSIYGKVLEIGTSKGISNINILNKRSGQIVATNESGDFYMRALPNDSILISTYGYKRVGLAWDGRNKNPIISVKQEAIMLQEVVVIDKKYVNLQKEIAYFLAHPHDSKALRNEILKSMINTHTSQPMSIGVSIDALYDMFSKEGKEKRKLADLQFNDVKTFYADLRYNKQIVAQITHLPEDDLEEFMGFCKPTQDFILTSSDYELTFKILKCLGEFRNTRIFRRTK
jgi:CarboxypepD_reg-like domain